MTKRVRAVLPGPAEDTRYIELTQGSVALVDVIDANWLGQWNWHLDSGYARRNPTKQDLCASMKRMHREIADRIGWLKDDMEVDHRDGNKLNNRRANLRPATSSENAKNARCRQDNKSGWRGVCWRQETEKWRARIYVDGQCISLGCFDVFDDAKKAYEAAALDLFRDFKRSTELY